MPPKSPAIAAARRIVRGDIAGASRMLGRQRAFRVFEIRALAGACRYARERLGAPPSLSLASLLFGCAA